MPQLPTHKLELLGRRVADGYALAPAAKAAGYRHLRVRAAAARLARSEVAARVAEIRAKTDPNAAGGRKAARSKTGSEAKAEAEFDIADERPPLPPILTEEEWMAKYGPMLRERAGAAHGPMD